MEPSIIISIIALTGTIFTGLFSLLKGVRKSECIGASCERASNAVQIDVGSDGVLEGITIPQASQGSQGSSTD